MSRHVARRAFTVTELLVALAVTAILATIAVPSFKAITKTGNDTQVRSTVDRAALAQVTFADAHGQFTPAPEDLLDLGRDLTVTAGVSDGPTTVSIAVSSDGGLALAALAEDGVCLAEYRPAAASGGGVLPVDLTGQPCLAAAAVPAGLWPLPATSVLP